MMDDQTRNLLRNTIGRCRKVLEEDVLDQLQGTFGIHQGGRIEPESALPHLDDEGLEARRRAVAAVEHIQSYGVKPADAVDQFQREVAFTHLNRLCAFKMLERRGLLEETVSRGANSNGFKVYLAGHPEDERLWQTGNEYQAYRHFLFDVCVQLSGEIKVLFDTEHISSHLFPDRRTLDGVLDLINAEPLADIWDDDDTIGWIYQYFTPKEQREKARKASAAPRNSYELAFRNQFYTPRYVVQFLTDNTLGRLWYEMRKGQTRLAEQCDYMVRRPTEIFLGQDEEPPPEPEGDGDMSQEEMLKQPVHVQHREKKLPWELKVLDPACGSGHFLLHAFDLLETIYDESYDDPDIGPRVQALHPSRERYAADTPAMILRHNLHGIDIDLRSTQFAALVLWMRAQRSYQRLGLNGERRPRIERTNIVCAEPMPGDQVFLDEFCDSVQPSLLGDLVRQMWDKMKLAGEAGSLLLIEEEIRDVVRRAQEAWRKAPKGYMISLFDGTVQRPLEQSEIDFSEVTGHEFWQKAESLLLDALEKFATSASNGRQFGRRLFRDDAEQGFAFIDLCRGRYDSVLMNPPFGESTENSRRAITARFPTWNKNLLCAFLERGLKWLTVGGALGAIFDRTAAVKSTYEEFRIRVLLAEDRLSECADLGWEVLDANVETCCLVWQEDINTKRRKALFFDVRSILPDSRGMKLRTLIQRCDSYDSLVHVASSTDFLRLPNAVLGYDMPEFFLHLATTSASFKEAGILAYTGAQVRAEQHFRLFWECASQTIFDPDSRFCYLYNGGEYSPLFMPPSEVALFGPNGAYVDESDPTYSWRVQSRHAYFKAGVAFGVRGDFLDAHYLREGYLFTVEGQSIPIHDDKQRWYVLGLLNSAPYQVGLNTFCGQHKYSGYINLLPFPDNLDTDASIEIVDLVRKGFDLLETWHTYDQTTLIFCGTPWLLAAGPRQTLAENLDHFCNQEKALESSLQELWWRLNSKLSRVLGVHSSRDLDLVREVTEKLGRQLVRTRGARECCADFVNWILGVNFGWWDVRGVSNPDLQPPLAHPPSPYPPTPPGVLFSPDGKRATTGSIVGEEWLRARPDAITLPQEGLITRPTIPDSEYPLEIVWDGILVDDPDHQDDIVRRVREVLELLWGGRAEAIEQETREILGVKSLKDYFGNPKYFWDAHVKRYSKSRRKAPVYWLLQSPRRHYALWLYYHRVDRDMLYKALRNYVDPKHRLEELRLRELREQLTATPEGREQKALEKQIDDQGAVVNDVLDFKERLEKVAALGLTPDLNDGVALNIAPLHELVPWKEPKKYWDELIAGKYQWSTIGKQLRERGLVRG